jgi:hypothetical protein
MRTRFFYKRITAKLLGLLSFCILLFCFVYAYILSNVQTYAVGKTFYFLVSSSNHIQASTHTAQNLGGAGFLLSDKDTDYVAYAAYTSQTEGAQAQRELNAIGQDVFLLPVTVETLYFKLPQDKNKSGKIIAFFSWLETQLDLLKQEIKLLERGITQQAVKRLLRSQERQFAYAKEQYAPTLLAFSKVCTSAQWQINDMIKGIVYLKDMRFLHCYLTQAYVAAAETYAL